MRILCIFSFLFTLFTASNLPAQSQNSVTLKLLSWNTFMIPAFPISKGQKKRAKGIVEVLKDGQYDIICFQEAYHRNACKTILKGLKEQYPYQLVSGDGRFSIRPRSGLWILSKTSIHKIKEIVFKDTKGLEGFFRKGAILFETVGLKDFHFIVSHLQSADGIKQTAVRKNQSLQIWEELIAPYSEQNKAVLLAGDWNMEATSTFDNFSLRKLFNITHPRSMPTENTWPTTSFRKNAPSLLLDLIMLNCPNNLLINFETSIPNLTYSWKKGKNDLSDHLPTEVQFSLTQ